MSTHTCCYDSSNAWTEALPEKFQSRPEFTYVERDLSKPNVLLMGDSISMSYTVGVRTRLSGVANVMRPPNNCRSTRQTLEHIEAYVCGPEWSVIHLNAGIHDITRLGADGKATDIGTGSRQVAESEYAENLEAILERLQAAAATVVWASSTPVQDGTPYRDPSDVVRYNDIAADIMGRRGIAVNDLYTFVGSRAAELQPPQNVHFTEHGAEELARVVAGCIQGVLEAN